MQRGEFQTRSIQTSEDVMKARSFFGFSSLYILTVTIYFTTTAQITVPVTGTKWAVVQYDTGSVHKFHVSTFLYHVGRKDGSAKMFSPVSRNCNASVENGHCDG